MNDEVSSNNFLRYQFCLMKFLKQYIIFKMGNENATATNRNSLEKRTVSIVSTETASLIQQNEQIPVSMLVQKMEFDSQIEASKNIFLKENSSGSIFISQKNLPRSMPLPSLTNCYSGLMASHDFGKSEIYSDCQSKTKHDSSMCSSETIDLIDDCPLIMIPNESVFDFYRIIEKMEEGRQIYKAKEIATGEFRTLKIVSKVSFKDKHLIKGEAEYQSLSKLNHPNIIKLYAVFQDFNKYYLILQYLKHQNLLQYLSKNTVDQNMNLYIITQILRTLKYMHGHGVVHRDIRLENILICRDKPSDRPSIKIINFGLSLNLHKDCLKRQVYGSIFYASPESFEGIINEKYDIWSVGIITLILFTEINPSSFESESYLINIIRKGKVYRQTLKNIPERVKQFVVEMLVFKNKKRPAAEEALKMEWISGQQGLYKRRRRKISNIDEELLYRY